MKFGNKRPSDTWKSGWREIGGQKKFFRSRWEANYCRYLQFLVEHKEIQAWEHEAETFWFEGIKRGTLSYLPDFRVTKNNGTKEYHEVKGWYDAKSKTKINRMRIYFPEVKLLLIDGKWFKANGNKLCKIINDWE